MKKTDVLFICYENRILPSAAKEICEEKFSDCAVFDCCYTGEDNSVLKEEEKDIKKDLTGDFKIKTPEDLAGKNFDIIITLCRTGFERCPQLPGFPVVINWSENNPFYEKKSDFSFLKKWLETEIVNLFKSGYFSGLQNYKYNMDLIINSLGDAVIGHDLNRKIFYFNSTAEEITGYTQKEVLGRDCHDIFSAPLCGLNCSFCEGIKPGEEFKGKSYETSFYDKSGIRRDCSVSVVPMKDSSGILKGVTASIKDHTELNLAKEQILKEQSFNGIIGKDPEMLKVFQQIKDLGVYDTPVHIHGATGTGKELVARAIHNESQRKTEPFVPINCGALPEGLIESELFGHVKGAFTGAVRDKKGRFELAHKGTIFLDEIGDLPKDVQVKLLRVLQEGTVEKVGGESPVNVDVRVISATNKELKASVKDGSFRDDLYYRLNVFPVSLPELKQRKNDIPVLSEHFLEKIAKRHGHEKLSISREALCALTDYPWPGNVRELENVIEYSVIHSSGSVVNIESLPAEIQETARIENSSETLKSSFSGKLNKSAVTYALQKAGGNKSKAAKILGVGRATLYRFINNNHVDTDI